jgi:hypothetical protein
VEYDEQGRVIPPPQITERRRVLTRFEAMRLVEVLDDDGFSCTLAVRGGDEYEVSVHLKGLTASRLSDLQNAISRAAPGATAVVGDYGLNVR